MSGNSERIISHTFTSQCGTLYKIPIHTGPTSALYGHLQVMSLRYLSHYGLLENAHEAPPRWTACLLQLCEHSAIIHQIAVC